MAQTTGTLFNGLTAKAGAFAAKGATCMDDAIAECAYWCGAYYVALTHELDSDAAFEVYQMGQHYYNLSDNIYIPEF